MWLLIEHPKYAPATNVVYHIMLVQAVLREQLGLLNYNNYDRNIIQDNATKEKYKKLSLGHTL